METLFIVIRMCAICLVSYFCLPVGIMQIINNVGFTAPFSKKLAAYGIYDVQTHKKIMSSRWIGTCILSAAFIALDTVLIITEMPIGLITAVVCVAIGIFVKRNFFSSVQNNIKRFTKSYKIYMDEEKYSEFLTENYGMALKDLK